MQLCVTEVVNLDTRPLSINQLIRWRAFLNAFNNNKQQRDDYIYDVAKRCLKKYTARYGSAMLQDTLVTTIYALDSAVEYAKYLLIHSENDITMYPDIYATVCQNRHVYMSQVTNGIRYCIKHNICVAADYLAISPAILTRTLGRILVKTIILTCFEKEGTL